MKNLSDCRVLLVDDANPGLVATVGPASDPLEKLERFIRVGLNVARRRLLLLRHA